MSFKKTLNKLENLYLQKPDKLLTVYLNTDRRGPGSTRRRMENCSEKWI